MDILKGGTGTDTVSYASSTHGVEIYLDTQVTWDGTTVDQLSSIENATGSSLADYIVGSSGQNVLDGGAGDDQILGMNGDDTITGGAGTDVVVLRGLAADYTVTAEGGGYRVTDNVGGRDGSDLLTGVESLRFSDGTTLSLSSAAPQVLPVLAEDKAAAAEVLPVLPGDDLPLVFPTEGDEFLLAGKFTDGPQVLPTSDADFGGWVLPAQQDGDYAGDILTVLERTDIGHGPDGHLILLDDTPFGVGNELDNHLTGSTASNWLLGGAGKDTLMNLA